MEYLALLARIVAVADEIRKQMKAKGAAAAAQFEEAVARNKVSFAEMVADLGGVVLPPEPVNGLYNRWREDPGDAMLGYNDHVYGRGSDHLVYISKGGPAVGFPGGPKQDELKRVVSG